MENVSQKNIKNGKKPILSRIIFAPAKAISIQYKNISQLDQNFSLAISQHLLLLFFNVLYWFPDRIIWEMFWLVVNQINEQDLSFSFIFVFYFSL